MFFCLQAFHLKNITDDQSLTSLISITNLEKLNKIDVLNRNIFPVSFTLLTLFSVMIKKTHTHTQENYKKEVLMRLLLNADIYFY